jgi:hypothetical protein
MMHSGYINFFEGECCFVAGGSDRFFTELREGDRIELADGTPKTLRLSNGRITYDGANGNIQGLAVFYDDGDDDEQNKKTEQT